MRKEFYMSNLSNKLTQEHHPLFPSGEWEGFYTMQMGPGAEQHKMQFTLNFKNHIVKGAGGDDVGSFSWKGKYDTEELVCNMTKFYQTHTVDYKGEVDENGIWGVWTIDQFSSGGFHIWPKKQKGNTAKAEKKVKKRKMVQKVSAPKTKTKKLGA